VLKSSKLLYQLQCADRRSAVAVSPDHCCCGKAINVTSSEFVSVALVIQHAMRVRRIVGGLPGCATFFCVVPYTALF
jgi:hypothetical protein